VARHATYLFSGASVIAPAISSPKASPLPDGRGLNFHLL
jgi:hypothetical protein